MGHTLISCALLVIAAAAMTSPVLGIAPGIPMQEAGAAAYAQGANAAAGHPMSQPFVEMTRKGMGMAVASGLPGHYQNLKKGGAAVNPMQGGLPGGAGNPAHGGLPGGVGSDMMPKAPTIPQAPQMPEVPQTQNLPIFG